MDYYFSVLEKYDVFQGRARRAEYWYFVLYNLLISMAIGIIGTMFDDQTKGLSNLYALIVFLPSLALDVRRLHDVGKSAWWLLLLLIPVIGWIWLFVLYLTDSQPGANKYGPNPKDN